MEGAGADAVYNETKGHAVKEDGGLPETPDEETVEGWSTPSPKTSSNEDVSGMGRAGSPASYLRSARGASKRVSGVLQAYSEQIER